MLLLWCGVLRSIEEGLSVLCLILTAELIKIKSTTSAGETNFLLDIFISIISSVFNTHNHYLFP